MSWLERARREICKIPTDGTAKTANRNLTAVMAVLHHADFDKHGPSNGSIGSTPHRQWLDSEALPPVTDSRCESPEWEVTIRRWLAGIDEADPDPVVERCRRDPEARAYFLSHARRWARHEKVRGWLAGNPTLRLAVVVEEEGERFIATVAVRGKGVVDLAIDRDKYDGIELLALVWCYGGAWPKMEAAA